jgi:predicted ATP-grasp superfamily ATP-dependent carboligase
VLVADDGQANSRSALAAVRALGVAGYRPIVTVATKRSLASSSRWCAGVIKVPLGGGSLWSESLIHAVEALELLTVIPASDAAVLALRLPGASLLDKRIVNSRARSAGLRVPDEQAFESKCDLLEREDQLPYPIVVKPVIRRTSNAPTSLRIDHKGQLQLAPGGAVVVQPFVSGSISSFNGVIKGGRWIAAVHQRYKRVWPPQCGASSAAETIPHDARLEEKLLQLVEGHEGIIEVEFADGHVIDVNPRAYGSLPLAVKAGANLPAIWCAAGHDESSPAQPIRATPGVRYRWLDADVRSITAQVRARDMSIPNALRALRPHAGTAHSIEDWRDPAPMLLRATQLGRYLAGS